MKISPQFRADPRTGRGVAVPYPSGPAISKKTAPRTRRTAAFNSGTRPAKTLTRRASICISNRKRASSGWVLWRPETRVAQGIRATIAEDPARWKKAAYGKRFRERFSLAGQSLKRPPRGYDPDHAYGDDLKRKDFIAVAALSTGTVTSDDFMGEFVDLCRRGGPLMEFLCTATGVGY